MVGVISSSGEGEKKGRERRLLSSLGGEIGEGKWFTPNERS